MINAEAIIHELANSAPAKRAERPRPIGSVANDAVLWSWFWKTVLTALETDLQPVIDKGWLDKGGVDLVVWGDSNRAGFKDLYTGLLHETKAPKGVAELVTAEKIDKFINEFCTALEFAINEALHKKQEASNTRAMVKAVISESAAAKKEAVNLDEAKRFISRRINDFAAIVSSFKELERELHNPTDFKMGWEMLQHDIEFAAEQTKKGMDYIVAQFDER